MSKLCQIIALAGGVKSRTQSALTEIYHKLQKPELLHGISRTYHPLADDPQPEDLLPPESKRVQYKVSDAIREMQHAMTPLLDIVFTQDLANLQAMADIDVNGETVADNVPVVYLLFLEKQLTDLHTMLSKLPTLDASEKWEMDRTVDCYATPETQTVRTKKIPRNHVVSEATKEHPAQVQVYTEDVAVGHWRTVKFSGAVRESDKRILVSRAAELRDAVKSAREQANTVEVNDAKIGEQILDSIFNRETF